MKKLSLLLAVVVLFCSACSSVTTQPSISDDITPTITPASPTLEVPVSSTPEIPASPTSDVSVPALLTADEARNIAQTWLDEHPDVQFTGAMPNCFDVEYSDMVVDDEDYYLFHLDNPEAYWFSILVHTETGALLYRMMPDGEFPVEEIEPLEDWYSRYYGV